MELPDPAVERALRHACAQAFPLRHTPYVSAPERLSGGWECDVFAFTVDGEEGGEYQHDELILRMYQGAEAREKAAKEFAAMRQLHRDGFPVPEVLVLETHSPSIDRPFVIMRKIDGSLLGPRIRQSIGEERHNLIRLFCRMFVDLHALDWRRYALAASGLQAGDHIDRWLVTARSEIRRFGLTDFDDVLDWLHVHRREVTTRTPSVIHWDYHPWNVLLRADGAAFVIDWTGAEIADFRVDLGCTLLLMHTLFGREMRDMVLREYERLLGSKIECLEYFEVMACARRLGTILISLQHGADAMGMRAGAEALMQESRSHVETAYAILNDRTGVSIPAVDELLSSPRK